MTWNDNDAEMANAKTFILGVGAQKAGTTWLHYYLTNAPNFAPSLLKELHIWDALHLPNCSMFKIASDDVKTATDAFRSSLLTSPQRYFEHFGALLNQKGKEITSDITPSYAGLDRKVLNYIRTEFADRKISTKAVFMMRDPVERCWSASRMNHKRQYGDTNVAHDVLLAEMRSPDFEMRTRYDLTLGELDAAFAPQDQFIGFYEKLGDVRQLNQLSTFCGVAPRPELAECKVHISPKVTLLDTEVIKMIASQYRDVYEYVAHKLPEAEALWPGYKYL